jgi:S1-C subfamily serine protease
LKKIAVISCAALFAVSSAACFDNNKEIINAYDIAVKNGFVGTEQEWLQSLKGENGQDAADITIQDAYEAAKADGFEGSFMDFLKEFMEVDVQEDNDTAMIANNIMSVVGIYCSFTKTTMGGMWGGAATSRYTAAGSGVIIDLNKEAGNALIVTNYHVIYDAESETDMHISDSIYLYTYGALNKYSMETGKDEGGAGIKATYVGGAMDYDLAVLKVEGSDFIKYSSAQEAKIGNSEETQVGEKVFVIGNAEGAGIAVTSGSISVESEYIAMSSTDGANREVSYRVMRTDAAINHGNSGGALFNAKGELIGITNAKNISDDVDNMGYALPITQVKYICENLMDNGGVVMRAMLGVIVKPTASNTVFENGRLKVYEEFIVDKTAIEQGAAAYNKLSFGDQFKKITIIKGSSTGETVTFTRRYQLNDLLLTVRKGDMVILTVLRDGIEVDVKIVYDQDAYFTEYK